MAVVEILKKNKKKNNLEGVMSNSLKLLKN